MNGGSLLLSNSEYVQNQAKFYSELLESQELTDVTLACDGYQVGAHRTVLSASSLFFRDVIKDSKHQNPFIYLKGVSKESLESMLQFIYAGETTVQSENLERLIEIGKELKVIGLMEDEVYNNENMEKNESINKPKKEKTAQTTKLNAMNTDILENQKINEIQIKSNQKKDIPLFVENLIEIENREIENTELEIEISKRYTTRKDKENKKVHVCTVCNKEGNQKDKMRQHIETHLEGFSHKCRFCDVVKKTRGALSFHQWQYHTGPNAKMAKED